ncbi:MAG: glycosyltransferase family 2 protein [Candidatus Aminicenantia bacterium]
MEVTFSVIIFTKNSISTIKDLVESLKTQKVNHNYEIICVDSGSKDGTVEYLKSNNMRLIQIPEREFHHSRTRMRAAKLAKGKFVIFLTDDILPTGSYFLENLTKPVLEGKAEASYGVHQVGGNKLYDPIDAFLHNKWYLEYEDISEPISMNDWHRMKPEIRRKICNFDNCASCINKDTLLKFKLPDVPYGEDMCFAKRLILNNCRVALAKKAKFYHWHNSSFSYVLKRMCIDQHLSIKEFGLYYVSRLIGVVKAIVIRALYRSYIALFKLDISLGKKIYWIVYNIKLLTADFLGKYIGTLDESKTRGILSPLKKRLFKLKKDILNKINTKALMRY